MKKIFLLIIILLGLIFTACSSTDIVKGKDVIEEKFYTECDKIVFWFPNESTNEITDKDEIAELCAELKELELTKWEEDEMPIGDYHVQLFSGEDVFEFGVTYSTIMIDRTVYDFDNNQLATRLAGGGKYKSIKIEPSNQTSDMYELDAERCRYFMIEYAAMKNHGEIIVDAAIETSADACKAKVIIEREDKNEMIYLYDSYVIYGDNIYEMSEISYFLEIIKDVEER